MKLVYTFWLLLFNSILALAAPNSESPLAPPIFGYDEREQASIAYDRSLTSGFDYDSVSAFLADEKENRTDETDGLVARFVESIAAKTGADSALQGARLGEHLRQLEKYGQAGFKELESGRLRYYGNINPATTPGTMAGRRLVREWDPSTGAARTWHETVDQAGRVRIVRPETGGSKVHYMFDEHGNYTGSF